MSRLLSIAWLAGAALLVGCEAEPLVVQADGCWGTGVSSVAGCLDSQTMTLRAMGKDRVIGAQEAADSPCGDFVDCSNVAAGPPPKIDRGIKRPQRRPKPASTGGGSKVASRTPEPSTPRPTPVRASETPAGRDASAGNDEPVTPPPAVPVEEVTPEPTAEPAATPKPTPKPTPEPEPVAVASGACEGKDIEGLGNKSSLAGGDLDCLKEVAQKGSPYSDAEVQIAAVSLFNAKTSGWGKAVEAALSRSGLKNAPRLNFAGIKPAYDGKRYTTTLSRARKTWEGMNSGLPLSTGERSFVAEFACRASGQLVLGGKDAPSDALDWCERWLELAEREGGETDVIEDLIRQVE